MKFRHPLYTEPCGFQFVEQDPVRSRYRIVDPKSRLKWSVRPSPFGGAIILNTIAVNRFRMMSALYEMNR